MHSSWMRTARYIAAGAVLVVVSFVALAVGEPGTPVEESVATAPIETEASTPTPLPTPTPEPEADGAADVGGTVGLWLANTGDLGGDAADDGAEIETTEVEIRTEISVELATARGRP